MPKTVLALNGWSVELRANGYWYFGETYRDDPEDYRGPYSSMTSVALMIARETVKEIMRRRNRLVDASPAE